MELFGQGVEPPVQDPNSLNNGAMPRYEITWEDPIVNLFRTKNTKKPLTKQKNSRM